MKLVNYLIIIEDNGALPRKKQYWDENLEEDRRVIKEIKRKTNRDRKLSSIINTWLYDESLPKYLRDKVSHTIIEYREQFGDFKGWDNFNKTIEYKKFQEIRNNLVFFLTLSFNILRIKIPDNLMKSLFPFI